jgi:hypothetical protein
MKKDTRFAHILWLAALGSLLLGAAQSVAAGASVSLDLASVRNQAAIAASFDFAPLPANAGKGVTIALLSGGPSSSVARALGRRATFVSARTGDASPYAAEGDSASFSDTLLTIVAALAPGARIVNVKIVDKDGSSSPEIVSNGIDRAVRLKAKVIVIPVGMSGSNSGVAAAVGRALKSGALVVASSGDESETSPRFPANMDGVLAIGAVDAQNTIAQFSNTGSTVLYAPGVDVAGLNESGAIETTSGASHAAAVAGAVFADLWSQNPKLRSAQLANAVRGSARQIADGHGGTGPLMDGAAALHTIKAGK